MQLPMCAERAHALTAAIYAVGLHRPVLLLSLCQAVLLCLGLAFHACALRADRARLWCLSRQRTHSLFCLSPRPLCIGVTHQVSAAEHDYPTTPMLSLCPRPRCALTELHLTRAGSGSSPALAPLSKARAIARARISWANVNFIFSFSDG